MKGFIIYIAKWIFIILLMMTSLDLVYTFSYKNNHSRSVYQIIRGLKNQKYDYIFLGSSRVKRHINHELINKKTKLKGLNLGISAGGPNEILIYLQKWIQNNNHSDKVFIDIGDKWNQEYPDTLASVYEWPFIHEDYIYNQFKKTNPNIFYEAYFPFYRYAVHSTKIGYRSVIANIKEQSIEKSLAFRPYQETMISRRTSKFSIRLQENKCIQEIINLCKKHTMDLYFFTSPYLYNQPPNIGSFFQEKLLQYTDFSNLIKDSIYYRDPMHLNKKGADIFSEHLIQYYFKKSDENN